MSSMRHRSRIQHCRLMGLLAAFAFSYPAQSAIIDFELPTPTAGPTYSQDGFTLTSSWDSPVSYGNWILQHSLGNNANGNNATINQGEISTTITSNSGSAFDFQGISFASVFADGARGYVDFTFNHADGTQDFQSVLVQVERGLEAFTFDEKNLISLTFSPRVPTDSFFSVQFDFLNVQDSATAVPELATWAMFLTGFGLIGGKLRNRVRLKRFT